MCWKNKAFKSNFKSVLCFNFWHFHHHWLDQRVRSYRKRNIQCNHYTARTRRILARLWWLLGSVALDFGPPCPPSTFMNWEWNCVYACACLLKGLSKAVLEANEAIWSQPCFICSQILLFWVSVVFIFCNTSIPQLEQNTCILFQNPSLKSKPMCQLTNAFYWYHNVKITSHKNIFFGHESISLYVREYVRFVS